MIDIMFRTGSGVWSPLAFLAAAAIILAVVYVIRSTGTKKYKKGTEQTLPFFSGNKAPEKNIASGNLYWGFFEALKKYYGWLTRLHTGIINDYVYSFVLLLVIIVVALLGGIAWA
jgi:NADH:ubiquinone oxidoreductase subunit 6 (subunit J)